MSGAASVGFGGVLAIEGGRRNVIILSARSLVATGGCPADPRSAPSAATMSGTLVARTRPRLGVLDAGRSCNDRVRERIARPELARAENELDGRREPKLQRPPSRAVLRGAGSGASMWNVPSARASRSSSLLSTRVGLRGCCSRSRTDQQPPPRIACTCPTAGTSTQRCSRAARRRRIRAGRVGRCRTAHGGSRPPVTA